MDLSVVWRAGLVQLLAVAALFALLVLLPLPSDFFRENGAVIGPLSWVACSLVTGRALRLPARTTVAAAVLSGAAAGGIGVLVSHSLGLVVGVGLFGVLAGAGVPADRRPAEATATARAS